MQSSHQILCYSVTDNIIYQFVPDITLMYKLKVSFQAFAAFTTIYEKFPTACSLFAVVPYYLVVNIMVASLVQEILIKIAALYIWQSVHSEFFLW